MNVRKGNMRGRERREEFQKEEEDEMTGRGGGRPRRWRREANLKVRMMRMHCLTSALCATGKLEM